ncbi:stage II sporulation protein M [Rubritalea tangerina]|uniref:Stage II sporulation protein M n=1 Tax=Rubritalea tangerina TaxID=430798 RepID=A0ABW4Z771_9BACT
MNAKEFESKKAEKWSDYDHKIQLLEKGKADQVEQIELIPKQYRERCVELSTARHRMYGEQVCEFLNQQVIRGHKVLARSSTSFVQAVFLFLLRDFPKAVRGEWKLFVLCWVFFLVPLIGMWVSVSYDLEWVRSILGSQGMAELDATWSKDSDAVSDFRDETGANFLMFGHYIHNNIGIDFQIIAGGAIAGVGSLFILLMNGLAIGGAMAYVIEYCDAEKFFCFVSGHSSYELTGMVIAGMAGMRIGLGIISPGRMTRAKALLESGKRGLPLVYGAFVLTFVAACVEGFWSAENFAPVIKYTVGILGWVALAIYFIFVGRGHGEA